MGILDTIPALQSTALVAKNVKEVKTEIKPSKKPQKSNFVKSAVRNIVGVNLIGATANAIKSANLNV
ncbi:MAG: hypothetical protein ABSG05_03530 [Candidatus Pacearchaeota archaeon]|jgi:preprotein translocase subunit Sss1